jgi:predicted TIM-barrel fold metal-dependent hydrolase
MDSMISRASVTLFVENGNSIADLLIANVLPRFPKLKFVAAETGAGWVPFTLEALDYHFKKYQVNHEHPEYGDGLPSDYFRRQVYATTWFEGVNDFYLDRIGSGNLLFETDYPHPTCLYGDEVKREVEANMATIPREHRENILWRNAAGLYQIDIAEAATASSANA